MKQYLKLCKRILQKGEWIKNKRTNSQCLSVIDVNFEYDVKNNQFPLITTRKSFYKTAISELLGYIRGYNSAKQFRNIQCNTWNANANENQDWINNPNRTGKDDMGRIYGVQGRTWRKPDGTYIDQFKKVISNLSAGVDDRAEIITFYNPGEIELGCLKPCMHTHTFSIFKNSLYLTSYQRSCDVPLGLNFNQIQCFVLLALISRITGHTPGKVFHKIINAHIYENQYWIMKNIQLKRKPYPSPKLLINPKIKSLKDLETWVSSKDFKVLNYKHHQPIKYPFTV